MKVFLKSLCIGLTALVVLISAGCSNQQGKKEIIIAEPNGEAQITVAMNPVIEYQENSYSAFEGVSQALSDDLSKKDFTLHESTDWRWMYYDEKSEKWTPRTDANVKKWTSAVKADNENKEAAYSYAFTKDATTALAPYIKSAIRVSSYAGASAPKQGVLLSVTGENEEGLCFIAPKSGKVNIGDPDGGSISAVSSVAGAVTDCLENDYCDRGFQVIIYHNGNPLWAAEYGNPRHYRSSEEKDGCYSIEFPSLTNIEVKEGDLISFVVKNLSDPRTALGMIPKAAEKFSEASRVVTKNGRQYIQHKEQPYLMYGVQLRLDHAMSKFEVATDEGYEKYIEPYFQKSAEAGFETVIFPIHWKQIETKKDVYNFDLLKKYYDYAKKYNLKVQLLWFGSNVCGWFSNCPGYIIQDTETYSRTKDYPDVINLYDADLIEREILVFAKLLDFLYEYDTDLRTVSIQIENEPNGTAANGQGLDNFTDVQAVEQATWMGQKAAVYNIMNALGLMVKQGPYRCVTRVNFMWYPCYTNGTAEYQLKEVYDLDGIDLVGIDTYQASVTDRAIIDTTFDKNIPHLAEFGPKFYIGPAMTMSALSQGGGVLYYQLKEIDHTEVVSVYDGVPGVWEYRTSKHMPYNDQSIYGLDTYELIAFNKMLMKIVNPVTTAAVKNMGAFNYLEHPVSGKETREVGGKKITYTNQSSDYGGSGLAVCLENGDYILLSQHGTGTFTFDGHKITGAVSVGRFEGDTWVEDATVQANGSVTITPAMAAEGNVLLVKAAQIN